MRWTNLRDDRETSQTSSRCSSPRSEAHRERTRAWAHSVLGGGMTPAHLEQRVQLPLAVGGQGYLSRSVACSRPADSTARLHRTLPFPAIQKDMPRNHDLGRLYRHKTEEEP